MSRAQAGAHPSVRAKFHVIGSAAMSICWNMIVCIGYSIAIGVPNIHVAAIDSTELVAVPLSLLLRPLFARCLRLGPLAAPTCDLLSDAQMNEQWQSWRSVRADEKADRAYCYQLHHATVLKGA